MIVIGNRRTNYPGNKGLHIKVDRSTHLGNPFKIGTDGTREQVIEKYRIHLPHLLADNPLAREAMQVIREHAHHNPLTLDCWCAPKACHAEVIKEYVERHMLDPLDTSKVSPMKLTFPTMPWFFVLYDKELYFQAESAHPLGTIEPGDERQPGDPDYWNWWPEQDPGYFDAEMLRKIADLIDHYNNSWTGETP